MFTSINQHEYLIGNIVTIRALFGKESVVIPQSVTIEFKDESGAIVTMPMTANSQGEYSCEFNTTGKTLGLWTYYIKAINRDAAGEGYFYVRDKHQGPSTGSA